MNRMDEFDARQWFSRAYQSQMEGQLDEAVALYKRSIELHPTAEAHTFLGWTYSFMGRYDDAIAECKQAIEIDPEFGNPWNDIGAYLIELGRDEEAIPYLERALVVKRYENPCFPHYNLGRVYQKKGMIQKAMDELRLAIKDHPTYGEAHQALMKLEGQLN